MAESFGRVDILGVTKELAPSWGDPVAVLDEIEFKCAKRARGLSEVLEASVVGETDFFEFVTFGYVEAEAGDAFEFAVRANLLKAGAL